ncbi:hypothetical protein OIU79_027995 [Salix purpurea]|uniref:Uncharacterized protein n=1 Tax=Salix purpurea TaxID=77065 RepID=A0A9Q0VW85_SALPP|nr:hypothetical protein OIU79_027995 [Salix purpurea]
MLLVYIYIYIYRCCFYEVNHSIRIILFFHISFLVLQRMCVKIVVEEKNQIVEAVLKGKIIKCTQVTCTASFDKRQDTHACSRGLTKRRFSDNYETLFIKSQIMQLTLMKRFVSSSSSNLSEWMI